MTEPRISVEDLERLVTGENPEDEGLIDLAASLKAWQAEFSFTPSEDEISRVSAQAAALAIEAPRTAPAVTESKTSRRLGWLRYKLATGLVAVLALSGMTGIAAATSDSAAPGDTLYGLDRALEAIGINDGSAGERIAEAQVLFNRGHESDAVAHLAEAVDEQGNGEASDAADALFQAAERLKANEAGGENAVEVRTSVAEMLTWMAETRENGELVGSEFGQEIAKRAKEISDAGPPVDNTNENASEKASKDGNTDHGPPDDVRTGPPDDAPANRP